MLWNFQILITNQIFEHTCRKFYFELVGTCYTIYYLLLVVVVSLFFAILFLITDCCPLYCFDCCFLSGFAWITTCCLVVVAWEFSSLLYYCVYFSFFFFLLPFTSLLLVVHASLHYESYGLWGEFVFGRYFNLILLSRSLYMWI